MKKLFIILLLAPFIALSQATRSEVLEQVLIVSEVTENSSLIIKTSNFNKYRNLVDANIIPLEIGIYRFKSKGNNAKLYTVTETYYSYDRNLISKYSNENEQNPSRKDYTTFWLSQVRTVTYGPVLKNSDDIYYTVTTSFNLE